MAMLLPTVRTLCCMSLPVGASGVVLRSHRLCSLVKLFNTYFAYLFALPFVAYIEALATFVCIGTACLVALVVLGCPWLPLVASIGCNIDTHAR